MASCVLHGLYALLLRSRQSHWQLVQASSRTVCWVKQRCWRHASDLHVWRNPKLKQVNCVKLMVETPRELSWSTLSRASDEQEATPIVRTSAKKVATSRGSCAVIRGDQCAFSVCGGLNSRDFMRLQISNKHATSIMNIRHVCRYCFARSLGDPFEEKSGARRHSCTQDA